MASDYEAHGSISNTQLAPQRKSSDTYFGELVLKNQHTGDSVGDNIRSEIFDYNTAHIRRYFKRGEKWDFTARLTFDEAYDDSAYPGLITGVTGNTVDSIYYNVYNDVSSTQYANASLSMTRNMYDFNEVDPGTGKDSIGRIDVSGTLKYIEVKAAIGEYYTFFYTDGTTELTNVPAYSDGSKVDGYYAEYYSDGKKYYFFSTSSAFDRPEPENLDIELLPVVSLQDNGNGELPYEATIPPEDYEFKRRDKVIGALGLEFAELSRQIFSYIPVIGSAEWNATYGLQFSKSAILQERYITEAYYYERLSGEVNLPVFGSPEWSPYRRSWKANMKNCCRDYTKCSGEESFDNNPRPEQIEFCLENATEEIYYQNLVDDKAKAAENIKNITDVHFGIFASAKLLDEESCVALYYTLKPVLEKMRKIPVSIPEDNTLGIIIPTLDKAYRFDIKVGSFDVKYAFGDWSLCRRFGVADPILFPPDIKGAKYKHGDFTVVEDSAKGWAEGDSYNAIDNSFEDTRPPDNLEGASRSMLELRVQDRADAAGNARFLELRLYDPMAEHIVDVIKDGDSGQSASVRIIGGLDNYYEADVEKPYSDVLIFPISYEAAYEIRIFKRERFLRECTIINVGAIKMEEIEWYQQGWFRIVMIIVSLVISYFNPYLGMTGLQSVLYTAAVTAILFILNLIIENPILKAIISLAMIYFTGDFSSGFSFHNALLAVEAAGVVVQGYVANEMIKLEQEMIEFRRSVSEQQKEMEKMKKEVGMDEFNEDWMLYIASLAPVEDYDEFYDRVHNDDLSDVYIGLFPEVDTSLPTPQG